MFALKPKIIQSSPDFALNLPYNVIQHYSLLIPSSSLGFDVFSVGFGCLPNFPNKSRVTHLHSTFDPKLYRHPTINRTI